MIIPDILDYLGGTLPYGIKLLPFMLIVFSLVWYVGWKGTGFWGTDKLWRVMIVGWLAVISLYTTLWYFNRGLSIPIRVVVIAGENGEKSPGAWAEGVADGIRTRLRAAKETFVIQDETTAPILFEPQTNEHLQEIAGRLRVAYIVRVTQSEGGEEARPPVRIVIERKSGSRYENQTTIDVPNVSLATAHAWAGEAVAQAFGGADLKGSWAGRHPNLNDSLLSLHYLAYSIRRMGDTELAAAFFMAEALAETTWAAPRIEYARTRLAEKPDQYEEEIRRSLLEAGVIDRENPESFILMGKHFLEFRDWDEAESALKLAYIFDPDDPRTLFFLTRLMDSRLSDLPIKTSRELLERALKLSPGYDAVRIALAEKYRAITLRREAIASLEEGLALKPDSRPMLLTLSAHYLESREYQKTIDVCNRLLAINPKDASSLYNLGLAYLWKKDYDRAVTLFDSSHRNGGSVENLYYCGVANQFKGDYPTAIKWFQKRFAVAQSQDDHGAASARARIGMLRDWILEDSIRKAGWKPKNPFERAPKAEDFRALTPPGEVR